MCVCVYVYRSPFPMREKCVRHTLRMALRGSPRLPHQHLALAPLIKKGARISGTCGACSERIFRVRVTTTGTGRRARDEFKSKTINFACSRRFTALSTGCCAVLFGSTEGSVFLLTLFWRIFCIRVLTIFHVMSTRL